MYQRPPTTMMANPLRAPLPMSYGQRRWLNPRQATAAPVHGLARFAFWTILLVSLTNAIGIVVSSVRRLEDDSYELSIYPIVFGVCMAVVLVFTKGRPKSTLLVVAWTFWMLYFLGGFLGTMQITAIDIRSTLRVTVKPWMGIVGLPLLALRAISEDKVSRLFHVTVIVTCLGSVVGILQVAMPGFMEGLVATAGRAEGLWSIPTTTGYVCSMVLLLTLLRPFDSRLMNWITRITLLAGVGATLSRGPLVALGISLIVYAVTAGRIATLIKSVVGLVFFVATTLAVVTAIEALSNDQSQRVAAVKALMVGDWEAGTFKDRTTIWGPALDAILSKGGLLFGLGHGTMGNIVGKSYDGISPHNFYIYVLGNSGIIALFGLLAFHIALFQQAFKFTERGPRAALIALATLWALAHMVDNSLIGDPTTSVVLACVVVAVAYARPRPPMRLRLQRPGPLGPIRQPAT